MTDSVDYSDFEGATLVHDLNQPLPEQFWNQYDCVIDGGTLEHVFNFPRALCNVMQAVKLGGRLFIFQWANNSCGHGFYCFSPELFFRALAPAYGFSIERFPGYEVEAPHRVCVIPAPEAVGRRRLYIRSRGGVLMMVEARKIGDSPAFWDNAPQQFDYVQQWDEASHGSRGNRPPAAGFRKHSLFHDMAWYARWQTRRQSLRRARKEDRLFSLKNARLFAPYLFSS